MITSKGNNNVEQIDLLEIAKLLWSKALSIILIAVLVAALTFAYTFFFIKPKYEATASMYVNNSSFTLGSTNFSLSSSEISASNSLVDAYIYILNSRTTLEEVIEMTGVDYTYEELSKLITTNSVNSTAAFEVIVTSTDPVEAELIANAVAKVLPGRVAEIVDGASVRIVDYAIIPAHRASPSYMKNTVIGALIGGIIACAYIIVKQLIRESEMRVITGSDDLKKMFKDIPVMAVIPDGRIASSKNKYYSSYYGYGEQKRGA